MSKLKGLKVSLDTNPELKKGIGAKSLKDLKEKIATKFDLSAKKKLYVFLPDGTEIDDDEYFDNLASQTNLIASSRPSLVTPMTSPRDDLLDQFFQSLRWQGGAGDAVQQIRELLLAAEGGEDLVRRWQTMANFVQNQTSKMTLFRLVWIIQLGWQTGNWPQKIE